MKKRSNKHKTAVRRGQKSTSRFKHFHTKNRYSQSGKLRLTGTFRANPRGFGFVESPDLPDGEDLFIPASEVNGAWNGDLVEAVREPGNAPGKMRGSIRKVLQRSNTELVGTYAESGKYGFLVPDDQKFRFAVFIPKGHAKRACTGDKIVAEIIDYGNGREVDPTGTVKEVLGASDEPGMDIYSIVRAMGIPSEFPPAVRRSADRVPHEISSADAEERRDLRGVFTVTIDGEDAKDLDDAVTLEEDNGIYRLGVHIADVSQYVEEDSAIDREAFKRGTSVYLADRVIPMLPEELSNGICSLNAGTDRLALSIEMQIDESGRILDHEIFESVIRVDERMSYRDVKAILEHSDPAVSERYAHCEEHFVKMRKAADLLNARRVERGAIVFEFPEAKIRLDEMGVPVEISARTADCATEIIEEFMLAANETIAEEFCRKKLPFVYRIHEDPDPDRIEELISFAAVNDCTIRKAGQKITPKELQQALDDLRGKPCERLMNRVILRSMQQACYSSSCKGHFGLAARYYCHFTSPIRRYPDLQIHRVIKDLLHGRLDPERIGHYKMIVTGAAEQSSLTERRAVEAERETEKLKKAQYMEKHIGEVFDGIVSSVTSRGLYVELENTVEGLVDVMGMCDDYYDFDEERMVLKGRLAGRSYTIGDPVKVRAIGADLRMRTVDFELE